MIVIARDMGPAELLDYDRTRAARRWCSRRARRSAMSRSSRARWTSRWSAARPTCWRASSRATRSWSTATTPRCWSGPAEDILQTMPCRDRRADASAGASYAALRDLPSATRDQARDLAAHECRPADRHAASRRDRRRRRRPLPHRDPVHGAFGVSRRRRADLALQPRARHGRRPARRRSARSMSAATRCCPMSARSATRIRRWAGARSASGSIARRCCAGSCAR